MRHLLRTCALGAALLAMQGAAHAYELRINMPDSSHMHLYSPDEYVSATSFTGQETIRGTMLLVSSSRTLDKEVIWSAKLLFRPDPEELGKLPRVRYAGEADRADDDNLIEVNNFHEDEIAPAIETLFGEDAAARAGKEAFERGIRGSLTLDSYRTGVECDRRYYYAHLVSFENAQDMEATQVRELVEKLPNTCG